MNRLIPVTGDMSSLAAAMRKAVPRDGTAWDKFIAVLLKPKENIKAHKHVYHTVLYYPEDCEPVVFTPTAGAILYLPPGTVHSVPPVKNARLSAAMLVEV